MGSSDTTTTRVLGPEETHILGEVEYIVGRAASHDARVVTLGPLAFFSTQTGDAWVLDVEDNHALQLAQDGDPLPVVGIRETDSSYAIEWPASYQLDGEAFVVAERSGRVRTILGYPAQKIRQAIEQGRGLQQEMKEGQARDILQAFEASGGRFRRRELNEALSLRDALTPELLGVLERVLGAPAEHARKEGYDAHVYAVALLAHWQEPAAHQPIAALFSLPQAQLGRLFGELIPEILPAALYRTSGGSLARIEELARNGEAHLPCRGAALKALLWAAAEGLATGEQVLAVFDALVSDVSLSAKGLEHRSLWAAQVIDLRPEVLLPLVERAYEDDRQDVTEVVREALVQLLAQADLLAKVGPAPPRDVHGYLTRWDRYRAEPPARGAARQAHNQKRKKARDKAKRARAARKKRRR